MDPDIQRELEEQFREMIAMLSQTNATMAGTVKAMNDAAGSLSGVAGSAKNAKDAVDNNTAGVNSNTGGISKLAEANQKATQQMQESAHNIRAAGAAASSFTRAMLGGEQGFTKYGDSVNKLGDGAVELGKNFGKIGAAAGLAVKALGAVTAVSFKQADALLSASDAMAKMGAANSFSTDQIHKMGQQVGLTSFQLDKMIRPMQSMGSAFGALGDNAADSVAKFVEMTRTTEKERNEFRRLGYKDDEERIQMQADFAKSMTAAGMSLRLLSHSSGGLNRVSLEYARNVQILADVTGRSVDEQRKQTEIATANIQFQMYMASIDRDIAKEKERVKQNIPGAQEELDRLQNKQMQATRAVTNASEFGGQAGAAQMAQMLMYGFTTLSDISRTALTGEAEHNARIAQEINAGTYDTKAAAADLQTRAKIFDKSVVDFGFAGSSDSDFANMMNFNTETLRRSAELRDVDLVAREEQARKKVRDNQAGVGQTAEDALVKNRDTLVETEREIALGLDAMLKKVSPLNFELGEMKTKAIAAAAALGALADAAKSNIGPGATGGGGGGLLEGAMGGAAVGGGARLLGGAARGAAGLAGRAMPLVSGAMVLKDAYDVYSSEPGKAKKEDTYGLYGAALGGVIGMIGGPLGAAFGVGAGNMIGNAIGSYMDEKDAEDEKKQKPDAAPKPPVKDAAPTQKEITPVSEVASPTNENVKQFAEVVSSHDRFMASIIKSFSISVEAFGKLVLSYINVSNRMMKKTTVTPTLHDGELTSDLREKEVRGIRERIMEDVELRDKTKDSFTSLNNSMVIVLDSLKKFTTAIKITTEALIGADEDSGGGSGGAGGGGDGTKAVTGNVDVLDAIAKAEGTFKSDGYNTSFGNGKYLPGGKEQNLTSMTLEQVEKLGQYMRKQPGNPNSSAMGRYQILTTSTMKDAAKALGLDLKTTKFNEEVQDKMAMWIVQQQGLKAWEGFKRNPKLREEAEYALANPKAKAPVAPTYGGLAGKIQKETESRTNSDANRLDIIALGKELSEKYGIKVTEHPNFPPFNPGGHAGAAHREGRALDLNIVNGEDAKDPRASAIFDKLKPELIARGFTTLWKVPGHYDHMHVQSGSDGIKEGTDGVVHAAKGGMFNGPKSGYPAVLHGTEIVAPLDRDSILAKLAKTPATQAETANTTMNTNITQEMTAGVERLASINSDAMYMLADKMSNMINILTDVNDHTYKLLQMSKV